MESCWRRVVLGRASSGNVLAVSDSSTKILILGGTGFLGSSFAAYAEARGFVATRASRTGGIGVLEVDVTSVAQVSDVLQMTRANTIVFGASRLSPRSKVPKPADALVEPKGMLCTLEAAAEAGVRHLVYFSSGGAVYGDGQCPHRETDTCAPRSLYGSLKLQTESLIDALAPTFGIRHTILRIGNPYGPGQSPYVAHGVIAKFLHLIMNRQPVTVLGSLEAAKDYVFIDDLNEAVLAAIRGQAIGTFNIGSGRAVSLEALLTLIENACGTRAERVYQPLPDQEVSSFALAVDRAASEFGWKPTTSLSQGISLTHAWMMQQGHDTENATT